MSPTPSRWTLERRIPAWGVVLLIFTCLGSGIGAAMAAGQLTQRVDTLEERSRDAAQDHDLLLSVRGDIRALQAAVDRIENRQIKEGGQ